VGLARGRGARASTVPVPDAPPRAALPPGRVRRATPPAGGLPRPHGSDAAFARDIRGMLLPHTTLDRGRDERPE
jgi:hypothetical protein